MNTINVFLNNNVIWFSERKDIPQKLFFKFENEKAKDNEENFKFWKRHDIIDMSKFEIKEYIYKKDDKDWVNKLNSYNGTKPLFIIINRAYLTTKSNGK